MAVPLPAPSRTIDSKLPIRVMLVDDSAVVRGFVARMLKAEPGIEIVATASDGALGVASLKRIPADVIILDIEMPNMDGLTAIPLMLAACPSAKIVMSSTLTLKNAGISLKALSAGASDYLTKPTAASSFAGDGSFGRELVEKVRALGAAARRDATRTTTRAALPSSAAQVVLRPWPQTAPKYVAIGSSTGGPQALFEVLKHLGGVTQPIFVTQHMPPSFTTILAEHIARQCGVACVEAQHGMPVRGGRVHLAPGGYHMTVTPDGKAIALNQDPPENFCRPAVDVMLRSLAAMRQPGAVAILTGMGSDGSRALSFVTAEGASVIAQDEATSVVWGMPGTAAATGQCSAVLPLPQIGPKLKQLATKA